MSLWEYANPVKFLRLSERVLPWLWALAALCLIGGLAWGFFGTPDDYRQGSTVKIIYIHVPAALMAINGWFLILFLFYLGYMALWSAIEDPDTAADLTSVLCLVGSVFAVLSRYAVNFWNQGLHQGASLSLDKEKNVADVFYQPLLVCIAGFVLLFLALVLYRTGTEIRVRRTRALRARQGAGT